MTRTSRNTKQKELMNIELGKLNVFFTAEDFYKILKKKDQNIGIATVYRHLRNLEEQKKIHSYLCDRKTVYSREHESHCHFVCKSCNQMTHFNIDSLDPIKKKVKGDICHFEMSISGYCEKCLKKDKNVV